MVNLFRISVNYIVFILIALNLNLPPSSVEAASLPHFRNNITETERVCQNVCSTRACRDYEEELAKYMNTTVDPCDNFYEFTCGNFKQYFPNPLLTTTLQQMTENSAAEIVTELNRGIREKDSAAIRKLKTYYQNCMNKTSIQEKGDEKLLHILNRIGGWPVLLGNKWRESDYDLMNTIYQIRQENVPLLFPIQFGVKETSNKTKILVLDGPAIAINNLFFLGSEPSEQKFEAYFQLMVNVATSLGANKSVAEKELLDVLVFEKNIYDIMKPQGRAFIAANEMIEKFPRTKFNISWFEMINNAMGVPDEFKVNDEVFISNTNYFEYIEGLLDGTSKKVVANFVAWNFIRTTLKYQPNNLQQLDANFIENITDLQFPDEYRCYNDIAANLPHALSALFIRISYDSYVNQDVVNLFHNIKEEFKINLEKLDWMDDEVRRLATRKVDAMSSVLPYNDNLLGDKVDEYFEGLEIKPGGYFESFLNVSAFNNKRRFEGLNEEYNKSSWIAVMDSVHANAYYQYFFNQMNIPAGLMRAPLYHPDRPQCINYGAAGTIIGHEITHGFDSTGQNYDENGYLKAWWQPETLSKFLGKVECLINQYNNFTLPETGQLVDGSRTRNENIADNGGFKMAYYAYQSWVKRNRDSEDCLSSINYTPQQLFWISAANNWCSVQSHEVAYISMSTDVHSPPQARVINSFSNIEEFAKDFQCKKGSRMNPEKRCVVW